MSTTDEFSCFFVDRDENERIRHRIRPLTLAELPAGEVTIRVAWSSLNYKDYLASQGHPGVAGQLPHIPGIDAAGIVAESDVDDIAADQPVVVTGYELGAPAWGGWSEFIRVPAEWVVPLPLGMSLRQSMVLGTAGFTAAQSVRELQTNSITPDSGPIVVTGASGGVGCWTVRLLAHLGYEVHAVSGKKEIADDLLALGAAKVHGREAVQDNPERPMLKAKWAGAVDTVGGSVLDAILKSTHIDGCVSACGLVAGDKLNLTVYPFILRGVKLAGVTSSSCPREPREWIWQQLSGDWQTALTDRFVQETTLSALPDKINAIGDGKIVGRTVVNINGAK